MYTLSIHISINKFIGGLNGQMPLWHKKKLFIQKIKEENVVVLHDFVICLRHLRNAVSNIRTTRNHGNFVPGSYFNRFHAFKRLLISWNLGAKLH